MLFNSILYLLFFFVVFFFYWILKEKLRKYLLVFASMIFYATWGLNEEGLLGIRWSFHFFGMILISHFFNILMGKYPKHKKTILFFLILILVGNLVFFKYSVFLKRIFLDLGFPLKFLENYKGVFLPLAISFYTFQIIAYSVDMYRGHIKEQRSFIDYFLFIIFFPQLIAGPIMRYSDFFYQKPVLEEKNVYLGSWYFLQGLVKKVLIADPMGNLISVVFQYPETFINYQILLGGVGFSIQVYCDFSGYTDIARGSALLLGYNIPENFNAPFFSRSARELWQRWHITLATWLRDYIYIPLGGSKISEFRTYLNQIITFTIGGFWHGADYTYIAWGSFWGFLLSIERFVENKLKINTIPTKNVFLIVLKVLLIFYLFSLGALMFRANPVQFPEKEYRSVEIMIQLLKGSFMNTSSKIKEEFIQNKGDYEFIKNTMGENFLEMNQIPYLDTYLVMFLMTLVFHILQYQSKLIENYATRLWLLVFMFMLFGGIIIPALAKTGNQFIYFVF
ncbi:MAG: MBOAT family O-acyltransferase [Leptonema sp. (in: bacteria)]